ncbi:MAG: 2OG-Fe(II) oxygenase family protein [Caldilineaceae bacterium]|nr:2OG-Fe(II) oxygenase family protein [Caldilineaceae bacterium]MDE0339374.1 2OG-Fe(II) oxygenase family protein [Caldilineaceae bacterium]
MIDRRSADHLKSRGYLVTSFAALDRSELLDAFRTFIHRSRSYQLRFLQKQYGYAYDGFSFYGQTDSSHQAEDDLISTFVLSEFYPADRYPEEYLGFLKGSWKEVAETVRSLETALLTQLDIPGLLDFYHGNAGHMVSNNYYPPLQQFTSTAADNTRLSAHPDASLFTVFPFGIDEELELQVTGEDGESVWQSVEAADSILVYPGYLMEMWTHGAIKAMNHRVRLSDNRAAERFTFSFFSLPFPLREFEMPGRGMMTSEAYFEAYGALF